MKNKPTKIRKGIVSVPAIVTLVVGIALLAFLFQNSMTDIDGGVTFRSTNGIAANDASDMNRAMRPTQLYSFEHSISPKQSGINVSREAYHKTEAQRVSLDRGNNANEVKATNSTMSTSSRSYNMRTGHGTQISASAVNGLKFSKITNSRENLVADVHVQSPNMPTTRYWDGWEGGTSGAVNPGEAPIGDAWVLLFFLVPFALLKLRNN